MRREPTRLEALLEELESAQRKMLFFQTLALCAAVASVSTLCYLFSH